MGYVPLFDTLTTGTLHGRWPDIGLWPIVLSMTDRHGNIDVTHEYIASVTGLPVLEVEAAMRRFCDVDPKSRSRNDGGRRLQLIDPEREWGWHVINHATYREKARLLAKNADATSSGREAARKRESRQAAAAQPRPPVSAGIRLSDSDSDSDSDQSKSKNDTHSAAPEVPHGTAIRPAVLRPPPPPLESPPRVSTDQEVLGWMACREAYPRFAGRQDWILAERGARYLVREGQATWGQLLQGAQRFAGYAQACITSPQFVMTPGKFFSAADRPWDQPWEIPAPADAPGRRLAWKPEDA